MDADLGAAALARLLGAGRGGVLHAMGVTGVGLSGVSALFRARGWDVSGCDANPDPALAAWLSGRGVRVLRGHGRSHLGPRRPDLVLRSPAVPPDNPELAYARELGIPVARRGVALAALVNTSPLAVAVCGTHGKTTTSCFAVCLLRVLGLGPSWCVGGSAPSMGGVADAGDGRPGAPFVVEADESDGTLADYAPAVAVVTAVDADHMEHFASMDDLRECFRAALRKTTRTVVYCRDDEGATRAAAGLPRRFGYGFSEGADLLARDVEAGPGSVSFDLFLRGARLGRAVLPVPGLHNASNALAACSAALALGCDARSVFRGLSGLAELPGRRFERIPSDGAIEVRSDYSHHPAEVAALVATARPRARGRLLAVFQPHRYTRTLALGRQFPPAFRGVDRLLLLPVFAASERPLAGGRAEDLYREFRAQAGRDGTGRRAPGGIPVPMLADGVASARAWLDRNLAPGDLLLVVGAGDVVSLLRGGPLRAAAPRAATARVPLAGRTSYGVGGPADSLEEAADEEGLAELLRRASARGTAWRVLGQGTNVLVPDCGVRGVVLRLAGPAFKAIAFRGGGLVEAGCGAPGARLLSEARAAGLGGLEFMAGVPGLVGGWLAMNAGTREGAIGDRLVSMTVCDAAGVVRVLRAGDAGLGYRRCDALAAGAAVALRAVFRLERRPPAEIAARMEEARSRRFDFGGLRTAGSVFRNPPGHSAGRLLDEAGCKGLRVGGAYVCERHANVIATEDGATASDVLALSAWMHDKALARTGVDLKREIRVW